MFIALAFVGCGPDQVDVQDWMLRDYSIVRAGIRQDVPHLYRMEFRDDFTMQFIEAGLEYENTQAYDWEPTSCDSLHITPREGADLVQLDEATASPYSGLHLGVEVQDALRIEKSNGVTGIWYPGAMCIEFAGNHPACTIDDAYCWEAYPCEEDR